MDQYLYLQDVIELGFQTGHFHSLGTYDFLQLLLSGFQFLIRIIQFSALDIFIFKSSEALKVSIFLR